MFRGESSPGSSFVISLAYSSHACRPRSAVGSPPAPALVVPGSSQGAIIFYPNWQSRTRSLGSKDRAVPGYTRLADTLGTGGSLAAAWQGRMLSLA